MGRGRSVGNCGAPCGMFTGTGGPLAAAFSGFSPPNTEGNVPGWLALSKSSWDGTNERSAISIHPRHLHLCRRSATLVNGVQNVQRILQPAALACLYLCVDVLVLDVHAFELRPG